MCEPFQFARRALHHYLFNEVNHLFRLLLITILFAGIYLQFLLINSLPSSVQCKLTSGYLSVKTELVKEIKCKQQTKCNLMLDTK